MVVIDCTLMHMHEEDKGDYEKAYRALRWDGLGWDRME
jgi:hypothetical protein